MAANQINGYFNTLNVNNNNGRIKLDVDGNLRLVSKRLFLTCSGAVQFSSDSSSYWLVSNGNLKMDAESGRIIIDGGSSGATAVEIKATHSSGGITVSSGTTGTTISSTGDINIRSSGNDIKLGTSDEDYDTLNTNNETVNIEMEATNYIAANCRDFQVTTTESINLISQSGDFNIGTSVVSPFFKMVDGSLLLDSTETTALKKLLIDIDSTSIQKPSYDGILVRSLNNSISADLTLQTSSAASVISIGVEAPDSTKAIHETYLAYKSGTKIISLESPRDFSSNDIGKTFYWNSSGASENITGVGTFITSASLNSVNGSLTLTTGGTYTGNLTKYYKVEVDYVNSVPNRFKWSSDAGITFTTEQIPMTGSAITLENGITVTFSATSGHTLGSYWTFTAMPVATVASSGSRSLQMSHTLRTGATYLTNTKETDLQIKTSNHERMRITNNGQVGIGIGQPSSTFEVQNKIGKRILLSSTYTDQQLNPCVAGLINGGWVAVWESYSSGQYDIYGQIFNADGTRNGTQFRVNVASATNQSFPHVTGNINKTYGGFLVVWSTEHSANNGLYDVYGQLFDETADDGSRALNSFDIEINATSSYSQKYPRCVGLEDGNYITVWSSNHESSGSNIDVYFQKVTRTGNLSGGETKVNTTTSDAQTYPYVASITNNDPTIPGGFVISYMSEYSSGVYNIMYQQYDSSSVSSGSEVTITTGTPKTYGRVALEGLSSGGFVIVYNQIYHGDSSRLTYVDGGDQDTLTGLTSGAVGTLSGTNSSYPTQVKVTISSGTFQEGEDFTTNLSGRTEKVESISSTSSIYSLTGTDIELTLSRDTKVIKGSKYDTSSSTAIYTISSINTTAIKDDQELQDANPLEWIREYTTFSSQYPLPSISTTNDKHFMVAWTSGKIPSIYYQKFNAVTGAKLGSETLIQKGSRELKQRNPIIRNIVNKTRQDNGMVLVYDAETYDTSKHGVFGELINNDNPMIKLENGTASLNFMNNGALGLGTSTPESDFHLKSENPYITLQNSTVERGDGLNESKVYFKDFSNNFLAEIKGSYGSNYEIRNPVSTSLVGWYKFDHSGGTLLATDSSPYRNNATLNGFDLDRCWRTGKIRNALNFDGVDSYLNCGSSSSIADLGSGSFSIATWLKVNQTASTGATNMIISNSGGTTPGFFRLSLNNTSSSVAVGTLYTSSGAKTVTGSTTITDGTWHHLVYTIDSTNSKARLFVDGSIDSSATLTGTLSVPSGTPNVYIGALNSGSSFLLGALDDLRLYNTNLSSSNVSEMYNNSQLIKGKLVLKTNNGTGLETADLVRSVVINSDGYFEGLRTRGNPNSTITGTLTPTGTSVAGSNTNFLSELQVGDQIFLNSERRSVTGITSDTSLTVSQSFVGTTGDSTTERIPSILSVIDRSSNINMIMDADGNIGLGLPNPETRLHLAGTGGTRDLPYIYLTNTTPENTSGGRETKILFKGYKSSSHHSIGQIEVSHQGSSTDKKGQMMLSVNNGTALTRGLILNSSGYLGIGSGFNPTTQLEIKAKDTSEATILMKSGTNDEALLGGASNIKFQANGVNLPYAQITGSSDSIGDGSEGRLDFYTNDGSSNVTRMVMKNNGGITFYLPEPVNLFHISPVLLDPPDGQTVSLTGTTVTGIGTSFTDSMIGGIIYFKTNRVSRIITARGGTTSLTVSTSGTYSAQDYIIYYSGININSSGNIGLNTTQQHSTAHINGSIATGLKKITYSDTTSGDFTLNAEYNTLLVSTNNSAGITLNLPAASTVTGRIYNIKKTSSDAYNLIIDPNSSEKIDANTQITITAINKYLMIQSDGTKWHILSDNL